MGRSNEVLCILVAQGAAKLPEVKVEDTKKNLGLEPGPHLLVLSSNFPVLKLVKSNKQK